MPNIKPKSFQQKEPPYKVSTKEEVIEVLRNNFDKFAEFGVTEIGLFGSFVRSEATEESDVDLLISINEAKQDLYYDNYFEFLDFVDNLFENRTVDTMLENNITPINGIYICREVEYVIKSKDRLKRILEETDYLLNLSPGLKTIEDISNDETLKRATTRSFKTIGEAVKLIPKEVQDLSLSTEWSEIAETGDNLLARYYDIDYEQIYHIIKKDIPTLKQEITNILNQINRKEYLEYQNQIAPQGIDTSTDLIKVNNQEKLDIAIAKTIRNEFPKKFQNVAIAEIRDIIGAGDRAIELETNSESIKPEEYVEQIVSKSAPSIRKN